MITLKKTLREDLDQLFLFQTNNESIHMAAFTPEKPQDREAYMEKRGKIIVDPTILLMSIWYADELVGSVVHFIIEKETNISYWIDRKHWGKGIASDALGMFLDLTAVRPLYARVAFDNHASARVFEKCGFTRLATEYGFANARGKEIREYVYIKNQEHGD